MQDDDPVGLNGHLGKADLVLENMEPGLRKVSDWRAPPSIGQSAAASW